MESWMNFVFLNLVWKIFKRVSNASKKIRILNDVLLQKCWESEQKKTLFEQKVNEKSLLMQSSKRVFVYAKFKKSAWMNSWTKAWINFVFFKLGLGTFESGFQRVKKN